MSATHIPLSETQTGICILFLLVAPLAGAGLAMVNSGLGRSRHAAHSFLAALCVVAITVCVYVVLGRCWQGSAGEPSRVVVVSGKPWDWIGAVPPFFAGLNGGSSFALLVGWMGMIGVSLSAMIPLGSGAERWRLSSLCASAALLSGLVFPLFAHWAWGGGWLASLGVNFGMGIGFVDTGGTGTIHVVGGLTALSVTWILGARRGKFSPDGMPMAIPGHNVVFTLFGCLLALVGWTAMNAAGAILYGSVELGGIPVVAINTMLAASSAALAAAVVTRIRYGRPDASLSANGWVGGLVASASACAFVPLAASMIIGLIAGILVTLGVEFLEIRLDIDDPAGSVSVHLVAGLWGIFATGLFGRFPGDATGQVWAQLVGMATLLGFIFPLIWGLHFVLNRIMPMRVAPEGERQGMDLFELGAGAYPDFIAHGDDFMQR